MSLRERTARKSPPSKRPTPPAYNWGAYDGLLFEAARLKWQVLLTVTSPVPEWATAGHKDKSGVTRPNDADFKEFMTAVGKHYAGLVSLYAIWNEPNHPAFLQPQFNAKGMPESPRIYRGLFQAGYEGLRASGIAKPKVLMGETAPVGSDSLSRREIKERGLLHDVAPLAFLRETLCLNSKYQKASTCEMLPAYGYAHHAYTTGAGPFYKPAGADNVMIGVLSRLSSALDKAERAHAIPAHIPIYLTEFGIQSYPNRELGVSLPQQAEYDAIAEKIAWENPRVAAFSQYLLRDDPLGGKAGSSVHGGYVGFQTGLETVNGARKPLYFGFPVPLVVAKHGHGFSLWGLVRPSERGHHAEGAGPAEGLEKLSNAYDCADQLARLLVAELLGARLALARELAQPGGRGLQRPANRRLLRPSALRHRPRMRGDAGAARG